MTAQHALEAVIEAAEAVARNADAQAYWRSGCDSAPYYVAHEMFTAFALSIKDLLQALPEVGA